MAFNVVFLDPAGFPANKAERQNNCITISTLQVGAIASLSVVLQNVGDAICNLCTVQFFFKRSADPTPTAIPAGQTIGGNPLPPTPLGIGARSTFALQWSVPSGDAGTGTVYAQIETQSPPPVVDPTNMNLACNAERNVFVGTAGLAIPRAVGLQMTAMESAGTAE